MNSGHCHFVGTGSVGARDGDIQQAQKYSQLGPVVGVLAKSMPHCFPTRYFQVHHLTGAELPGIHKLIVGSVSECVFGQGHSFVKADQ